MLAYRRRLRNDGGDGVATTSWIRTQFGPVAWTTSQANIQLASLSSGQTVLRTRFGWGFGGTSSTSVVLPNVMALTMVLGLQTTIGNGSEAKADVITHSGDLAPPSQRWLWHERRWPTVVAYDSTAEVVIWQSSLPQEIVDTRAKVLAPSGMGTGNFLNMWVSFRSGTGWDPSGVIAVFGWANILIRSP